MSEKTTEEGGTVEISQAELEQLKERANSLETRLQQAEIEKARLDERAKASAPPAGAAPKAAPVLTREQLQGAVDDGQITQSQMDTEILRQARETLRQELSQEFETKQVIAKQSEAVQTQFDAYVKLRPDVKVDGSDDLKRVQAEIQALVGLGHPHDMRTEVLAMRSVFGPVDRIQETTRHRTETHRDVGGPAPRDNEHTPSGTGWEKGLTQGQIQAFTGQLQRKVYSGEDDKLFTKVVTQARTDNVAKKAS